jgi:hypothetical protein
MRTTIPRRTEGPSLPPPEPSVRRKRVLGLVDSGQGKYSELALNVNENIDILVKKVSTFKVE